MEEAPNRPEGQDLEEPREAELLEQQVQEAEAVDVAAVKLLVAGEALAADAESPEGHQRADPEAEEQEEAGKVPPEEEEDAGLLRQLGHLDGPQ